MLEYVGKIPPEQVSFLQQYEQKVILQLTFKPAAKAGECGLTSTMSTPPSMAVLVLTLQ